MQADYIVVGAGSAGSVITRRLIDAGHTVHVIEAGSVDTDPNIHSPQGWPALLFSPNDWAVMTAPQTHAANRSLYWPRGKVLGGSSSLNGMIYVRGHRSDYDGWAAEGNPGWGWDDVFPLFKRSEDHVGGASEYHGVGGPLSVEKLTVGRAPTAQAFVDAAVTLGYPETDDFNGELMEGVGFNDTTTRRGKRASAWQSFVVPILDSPLLTATTGALVHRILLEGKRAVGIEFEADGETTQSFARAEVIISAGTIGSPKILLLSGIGPSTHLSEHGIDQIVDLAGVGENLHDHLLVSNIYEAKEPLPAGANNLLESQLYTRSSGWDGPGPDLQPLFLHLPYPTDGGAVPENGYTIAPGIVRPASRGTLRLASANPNDAPIADPNVFADEYDLEAMVDAIVLCREIGQQDAFAPFRKLEFAPGPDVTTRDQLREFARRSVGTYHHQVGTCRMGTDDQAVVDPSLRVHGIQNLRVADASIMPRISSGNTNAPSIMIGEKLAELLLGTGVVQNSPNVAELSGALN